VGAGDDIKEPSGHWSFKSLSQSKPGIPSMLRSKVVGPAWSASFGILRR
jgi:hypothetical protein